MTTPSVGLQRLYNQQLEQTKLHTSGEVVAWFGAVQSQEYALAKWALGQRLPGAKDADIEQAFTEGSILRTHVMRPTWHFVAPADIRWLLELTAPRVNAASAYMYRHLELDDALFQRSARIIVKALQGGKSLTRKELGSVLQKAGIDAKGLRLAYMVGHGELDALICSGPRRGKQFTYALLEERAPQARVLKRDEALAELTTRFFTSHGPAKVEDFAWWSGLTKADAKLGLEMSNPKIVSEVIGGQTYWRSSATSAMKAVSGKALLLPPYDEYAIAYRHHGDIPDPAHLGLARGAIFSGITVIDCKVLGNWKRTISKGTAIIQSTTFRPFTDAENDAFAAAAKRFGEFLDMPVVLA